MNLGLSNYLLLIFIILIWFINFLLILMVTYFFWLSLGLVWQYLGTNLNFSFFNLIYSNNTILLIFWTRSVAICVFFISYTYYWNYLLLYYIQKSPFFAYLLTLNWHSVYTLVISFSLLNRSLGYIRNYLIVTVRLRWLRFQHGYCILKRWVKISRNL